MKFLGEIENTHDVVNKSYVESLIEGTATDIASQLISEALQDNATQTWVNQQGFLTEHQDLSGYQTKITSTNKLAYSLISGTPDLSVYLTTSSASSTYQPKITSSAKLAASLVSGLATVATSGSYNDLSNKPTIPTNTNQLTNGAGFITSSALSSYLPLSGGTLTDNLTLKSASASADTPKLYFQRGTTADTYYDNYIYNTGGGLTFGYSSGGVDYDLVKVTSTTLRPNSNNIYALGAPDYNWGNIYTKLINGGTPIHSNNIGSQSVSHATSATQLKTARTIWGQSFDGTADINGKLTYTTNTLSRSAFNHSGDQLIISDCLAGTILRGDAVKFQNSAGTNAMILTGESLGIGTASPKGKLHVEGNSYLRGTIYVTNPDATTIAESSGKIKFNSIHDEDGYRSPYIQAIYYGNYSRKRLGIFQSNATNYTDDFVEVLSILPTGNIGVNNPSPEYKLDVTGTTRITGAVTLGSTLTGNYWYLNNSSTNPYLRLTRSSVNWYVQLVAAGLQLGAGSANSCTIDASGNFLSVGGITQYSDIRKKTKLQDVELTLKQVANAPLIEHYYNSDDKKTTHVGSIAQYWAEMNDWFCKLDSDGYYTMEIQNAALASAISVARELERYESKTDKKIRLLKKRINELEDEIEKLKSA